VQIDGILDVPFFIKNIAVFGLLKKQTFATTAGSNFNPFSVRKLMSVH
jgi:hypothetical protein